MGVKPFNVMDLGKAKLFDPQEVGYRDSLEIIMDESVKIQKSFVKIGWYLKHIRDNELYLEDGYTDINECAAAKLGYSQSTVSRFINICEKFSKDHNSPELDEKYSGFDKSQMIEMLPLEQEQLENVTSDMTVREIREFKNEAAPKSNEPDDGEIRYFCRKNIKGIATSDKDNLKEYMINHYGKRYYSGIDSKLRFHCSPRGITINDSEEITWTHFARRVKKLEELIPGSCFILKADVGEQEEDEIHGQTSLEEDFPEYLPDPIEPDISDQQEDKTEYATSHKYQGHVIDGTCKEIQEQPALPKLKNNDQRKEWLENYKAWGLWYRDANIDVNYYKYDFPDGSRLVVAEYPQRQSYYTNELCDECFYHLLEKNKKGYKGTYDEVYRHREDCETYLVEFLKNLQKGS